MRRFKAYDRGTVQIRIEQNAQVSRTAMQTHVGTLYSDLERYNERRPILPPEVIFETKQQESAFSLPDALLWVFGRTFGAEEEAREMHYLYFERLRDKYRHIVNADTGEVFSRRHPIEIRRLSRTSSSTARKGLDPP